MNLCKLHGTPEYIRVAVIKYCCGKELETLYRIHQIIRGGNFCNFHGFLLTMNVLPLKIFLEYRCPSTNYTKHGTTWS